MKGGMIYPLKDPENYDDHLGSGFTHALPAHGPDEDYYIADCWIVDAEGNQHPGLFDCPVPVRGEDLEIDSGVVCELEFEASSALDSNWFN